MVCANYCTFGLHFHSEFAIPNLSPLQTQSDAAFVLASYSSIQANIANFQIIYSDAEADSSENPHLLIESNTNYYRWTYADNTRFLISADGKQVFLDCPPNESLENALTYFFGPIFRFLLNLHRRVSLHASLIRIDDKVALFVGDSGMGKSTLAAAFSQLGFSILSDDLASLRFDENGLLWVERGLNHIKLWPDSAALIGAADLPPLIPQTTYWANYDKRQLSLDSSVPESAIVGAIYILQERIHASTAQIEHLEGQARLLALLGNTYKEYNLPAIAAQEFEQFSRIANQISMATLALPNNGQWRDYCQDIIADFRARL